MKKNKLTINRLRVVRKNFIAIPSNLLSDIVSTLDLRTVASVLTEQKTGSSNRVSPVLYDSHLITWIVLNEGYKIGGLGQGNLEFVIDLDLITGRVDEDDAHAAAEK